MDGHKITTAERMWMQRLMAQLISLAVFCCHMASAPRDRRRWALAMLRPGPNSALRLTGHYAARLNFWLDLEPLELDGDSPEHALLLAQFFCVLAKALSDLLALCPNSGAPTRPQRSSPGGTVPTPCPPKSAYPARSRGPPPGDREASAPAFRNFPVRLHPRNQSRTCLGIEAFRAPVP